MKKVKSIFYAFKNSLTLSIFYYQKITTKPFSFSFKYFTLLILSLNLLFFLSLVIIFHPKKVYLFLTSLNKSLEKYPPEGVITIENGTSFSNYDYPFFLWLDHQNKKKLLFVFDESAEPSKIKIYKSLILLTSKNIVFNLNQFSQNKFFLVQPLNQFPNQKITKKEVLQINYFLNKIIKNFPLIYGLLSLIVFALIFIFTTSINLFYLFLSATIVYTIFKFFLKKRLHFKRVFQNGLHAATFPFVLDYLLFIFTPKVKFVALTQIPKLFLPFSFIILLSVFTFTAIFRAHFAKVETRGENRRHHLGIHRVSQGET